MRVSPTDWAPLGACLGICTWQVARERLELPTTLADRNIQTTCLQQAWHDGCSQLRCLRLLPRSRPTSRSCTNIKSTSTPLSTRPLRSLRCPLRRPLRCLIMASTAPAPAPLSPAITKRAAAIFQPSSQHATLDEFLAHLTTPQSSAALPIDVDTSHPLSHYFISSSHNTCKFCDKSALPSLRSDMSQTFPAINCGPRAPAMPISKC